MQNLLNFDMIFFGNLYFKRKEKIKRNNRKRNLEIKTNKIFFFLLYLTIFR